MRKITNDYLKYWRVIRYYVKERYGLTQADLDMILFLNSEHYFDKDKFKEFDSLMSWNKTRFDCLLRDGWIVVFRRGFKGSRAVYTLPYKTSRLIVSIYQMLSGEEIPMGQNNRMFNKNVKYTDKVYRNMIIEMNKTFKGKKRTVNIL
jgi:hypothetical protein